MKMASSSTTWAAISGFQGPSWPLQELLRVSGPSVSCAPIVMWGFGQKPPGPIWSWPQEAWLHWRQDQDIVAVQMGDTFSSIRSGLQLRFCRFSAVPGNCLQRSAFLKVRQWQMLKRNDRSSTTFYVKAII